MLELLMKVNSLSHEIFEVLPPERLKTLLQTCIVTPTSCALERIGKKQDIANGLQETLNKFSDKVTPETLAFFLTLYLGKMSESEKSSEILEIFKNFVNQADTKSAIEKFVTAVEKNAVDIGNIVEASIILASNIKNDLSSSDEGNDADTSDNGQNADKDSDTIASDDEQNAIDDNGEDW